jgi:hypothetical protein
MEQDSRETRAEQVVGGEPQLRVFMKSLSSQVVATRAAT